MSHYAPGSLWYYAPNEGAAIAFTIWFFVSFLVHLWQMCRSKAYRLTGLLSWGAAVLTAGYAMRVAGSLDYTNVGNFVASTVLIIMGPPVYAAVLYIVLGRMLYYIPWLSPMHPGRVITTFLGLDAVCEGLLGAGAPRVANHTLSLAEQNVGWGLIRAGMVLQCVLMIGFVTLATYFHYNCRRHGVANKIRKPMILLYVTIILILERTILRTIEMFETYSGPIYRSEAIFYVFEATVMLVVSVSLNIWHPARLLPESNKVYLAVDGVTERMGPGWQDKRPFLVTLFDPFDLGGLCSKRHASVRFWEENIGEVVAIREEPNKVSA